MMKKIQYVPLRKVKAEWFDEPEWWEMFCCRLTLVKDAAKAR